MGHKSMLTLLPFPFPDSLTCWWVTSQCQHFSRSRSQILGPVDGSQVNVNISPVPFPRFSDLLVGHMKQILIVLYVLAGGALWWIIMLAQQYIPFNLRKSALFFLFFLKSSSEFPLVFLTNYNSIFGKHVHMIAFNSK